MYDDHFYCKDWFDDGCGRHSAFCWCYHEADVIPDTACPGHHCRAHLESRSDCADCERERETA